MGGKKGSIDGSMKLSLLGNNYQRGALQRHIYIIQKTCQIRKQMTLDITLGQVLFFWL